MYVLADEHSFILFYLITSFIQCCTMTCSITINKTYYVHFHGVTLWYIIYIAIMMVVSKARLYCMSGPETVMMVVHVIWGVWTYWGIYTILIVSAWLGIMARVLYTC